MNTPHDILVGTQPVRVLQKYIPYMLENANPDFLQLTDNLIKKLQFNPGIIYHFNELAICDLVNGHQQTPYATSKNEIHTHETFLSYVWCISYSLTSLYDLAYPYEGTKGLSENKLNEEIGTVHQLFKYGISLIKIFSTWDKNELPNPEIYSDENRTQIFRANGIFLFAVCFILYHEFAHVEKEHLNKLNHEQIGKEYIFEFEKEADQRAIDLLLAGATDRTRQEIIVGILIGLCCLLFFKREVTGGSTHPDTDDRIHNFLKQIQPEPTNGVWGIAFVAYKMWAYQFSKYYLNLDIAKTLKENYYYIRQQVKQEKETADKSKGIMQ